MFLKLHNQKARSFRSCYAFIALTLCMLTGNFAFGQLTGVKSIPGDYPTIAAAITDLNTQGVGPGGVTFNIAAGTTETAPVGGYKITATGTAANPIVIQKSGVGTNPELTAFTGGTATASTATGLDGIFALIGSDYVTINGLSFKENPANSGNALMEYGIAFYKASNTNGCNNNTIQNCVITLNKNNVTAGTTETEAGSCGFWAGNTLITAPTVALTVTSVNGTNSNNKFYSNTIQNCNVAFSMRGFVDPASPYLFLDQSNDIGGNSIATGNNFIQFGGGLGTTVVAAGIKAVNCNNVNIGYNTVTSTGGTAAHQQEVKGIFISSTNIAYGKITGNTVSIRVGTFNGFVTATAVDFAGGSVSANSVVDVTNNIVTNCIVDSTINLGGNSPLVLIRVASTNAKTVNITGNLVYNDTINDCGAITGIQYGGSNLNADVNITNNQVYNLLKTQGNPNLTSSNGQTMTGINASSQSKLNLSNNQIHDLQIINNNYALVANINGITLGTGIVYSTSVTNNQLYNFSINGNSSVGTTAITQNINGINNTNTGTTVTNLTIANNSISGFSCNGGTGIYGGAITGLQVTEAYNGNVYNNKICDFTANGAGSTVVGMLVRTGFNLNIYNNTIGNLFTPSATAASAPEQVIGIQDISTVAGQRHNFYYNTVNLTGTSSGTSFGSSAIKTSATTAPNFPILTMNNNIFVNNTTPKGIGFAVAHRRSGTNITTYSTASNNNIFYAGTPGTTRLIYYDGTNSDQTLAAYKTRVAGRESSSQTENVAFLSTACGSANFLHVDPSIASVAESGGIVISGITTDIDGNARSTSNPDIGADEFAGILNDITAPSISFGTITATCNNGDRVISGVVISDATGVPTSGGLVPRLYYKKNVGGAYFSVPGTLTSGTAQNGVWSFTILAAPILPLTTADSVGYFFIAQDLAGVTNISSNPFGAVASDVNTVTTNPTSPLYYKVLNSLSGTYTVGVGGNYTTLTAAVAAYNTSCITGPVVFSLTDAAYVSETLPIIIQSNIYQSLYSLTIKPATGNVSIQGSSTSAVIVLNGADSIIIEGSANPVTNSVCPLVQSTRNLTITNNDVGVATGRSVVYLSTNSLNSNDGASNNIIRNCNITGGSNTITTAGIATGPSAGVGTGSALGFGNSNNIIENNNITKTQYGIISNGLNYANKNQNNIFRLNTMTATALNAIGRIGIMIGFENNALITGNTIKNIVLVSSSTDAAAISAGAGTGMKANFGGTNEVTNSIISKNVIDNITGTTIASTTSVHGIALGGAPSGLTSSGTNLISNNMISRVSSNITLNNNANNSTGIYINSQLGSTTQVYNNTINMNATSFTGTNSATVGLFVFGASGIALPSLDVKNNIISVTGSVGNGNNFCYGFIPLSPSGNYSSFIASNNNLYAANGGGALNSIGAVGAIYGSITNFPTLASWQTETGAEANSKNVLPAFVSNSDMHLLNYSASNFQLNGTALTLGAVADDIDCELRTGSLSPDMGADEFSSFTIDLAFDTIVRPGGITTCHSATEPIIVRVRNVGANTIDMSLNNINVSCNITGMITASATGSATSGLLAYNQTVDITLTPSINTTANGAYTFATTITAIAGETNLVNNTNSTLVNISTTLLGATASVYPVSICAGQSTNASTVVSGGIIPYSYSWAPTGGSGSTAILTPVASGIYTVTINDVCGNSTTATVSVTVNDPQVDSVIPNSRCGLGTVQLGAAPIGGATLNWYATPSSPVVLGTGNSFVTPTIAATTNFYVAAASGSGPFSAGLIDNSYPGFSLAVGGNTSTMNIKLTKSGAITGFTVYPFAAGTVNFSIRPRGTTFVSNIFTTGNYVFTAQQVGQPVRVLVNIPYTLNALDTLMLCWDPVAPSTTSNMGFGRYNSYTGGGFPFSTTDGSMILQGGGLTLNTGNSLALYNSFFNVEYTTFCESTRVPVTATVLPPPSLTISPDRNLCVGDTFAISVTSTLSNYDDYIFSPITGLYSDAGCTTPYTYGDSSVTTVYRIGTAVGQQVYTCFAYNAAQCSNNAVCTVTVQPALTSVSTNTYGICGSGSAVLSITPLTGYGSGAILWESSPDSSVWTPVAGSTSVLTTPTLTSKTYFRVSIRNSNNVACGTLGLNPIFVYNPVLISAPDTFRCGSGTADLSATVSSGATAKWYSTPTSQPALGTGLNFTTPVISSTTTFYAAASEGSATYGIGVPEASSTYGSVFVFSGISGPVTPDKPLWLTVVKPGTIEKLTVYPIAAGTMTINLRLRGSASDLFVAGPFTINPGQENTPVVLNVNIPINTPGLYQITNIGIGCAIMSPYNNAAGFYPFSTADGSLLINGSPNNSTSTAALTTTYNAMFNIKYNTACESARVPVVVTVNTPPPFSLNITTDTVCGLTPKMLRVTNTLSNYSTYTWQPAAGLFTDAAGTIPYVTGTDADTVYANPVSNTVYTATATDTVGYCVDTIQIRMTPIFISPSATTAATIYTLCGSGTSILSLTGIVNNTLAGYLWEESPDSINWTPISGATGTPFVTNVLTQTTYFRCGIYCTGSLIGYTPAIKVRVLNPQILNPTGATNCGPGTLTLSATANGSGSVSWYANATGGLPIGTGTSYVTPLINNTTTYYAQASEGSYSETAGIPTPAVAGGVNAVAGRGIKFSTNKELTILSTVVKGFSGGGGFIDIALLDNLNNELFSTGTVAYNDTTTVALNWTIPAGTDYQLVSKSGSGTLASTFPAGYPLVSSQGSMTVTGGMFQTNTPNAQYYFFYNIIIESNCVSARVPVVATILPTPPITVVPANPELCPGDNVTLSASSVNDPNYVYTWYPQVVTGATVTVSPTATTTYTVTGTDISGGPSNGCQFTQLVNVVVKPGVPSFSVTTTSGISVGSSINLDVTGSVNPDDAQIGTDTLLNNSGTSFPAPYGNSFESSKHQMLIRASELAAQGMVYGSEITSLAFDVWSVGTSGIHNNYTIRIANTNANTVTGWTTGSYTTVFGPVNYQPVAGQNVHTFASPYIWDGVSNLIIETCFSNDPTGAGNFATSNALAHRTQTAFNSVAYANLNDLDACALNPTPSLSNIRPNMVLHYVQNVNYTWAPGGSLNTSTGTSVIATPASTTTYTVTATNTAGCTATQTTLVAVYQIPYPVLTVLSDTAVCSNSTGFNLTVFDTVAYTGGYPAGTTFEWVGYTAPTLGLNTFFVNGSGSYTVIVTLPGNFGSGQAQSATVNIDFGTNEAPLVVMSQDSVNCNGESTGMAIATVAFGANPMINFKWYNSSNVLVRNVTDTLASDTLKNLPVGVYRVEVYNSIGTTFLSCNATDSVEVLQPSVLTASTTGTNILCNGGNNGDITVTATGGNESYMYSLNGNTPQASPVFSGLTAGLYTITVTDFNGCTATSSITLTEPPALEISCSVNSNVSCFELSNGSATVAVSGGTAPYVYAWSNGESTSSISNLTAGQYCVTVTDANGCSQNCCITITEPGLLTVSGTVTNVICRNGNNGTISVAGSGGTAPYSYYWAGGNSSANRTGLAPGTYCVTVTDANGCTTSACYTVIQPSYLLLNVSKTNVRCGGKCTGYATAAPTGGWGGYSYLWSTGETTASISSLCAGTYTITVTDSGGCVKTSTFSINQNPVLVALAVPTSSTSATANVSGGVPAYSYLWNTVPNQYTATATGLIPGNTYKVRVTDSKNCSKIALVTMPLPKAGDSETKLEVIAYPNPTDGIVTLKFNSAIGFDYTISLFDNTGREVMSRKESILAGFNNSKFDFSNLPKGMYQVVISSDKGNSNLRIVLQ